MYANIEPLLSALSREFNVNFDVIPVVEDRSTIRVSLPDETVEVCVKRPFMSPFLKSLAHLAKIADDELSGLERFEVVEGDDNSLDLKFVGTSGAVDVKMIAETAIPTQFIAQLMRSGIRKFRVTHKTFMTRKMDDEMAVISFVDDRHYDTYKEYMERLKELEVSCAVGWVNSLGCEAFFPKSVESILENWHSVEAASQMIHAGVTDVVLLEHNYSKYLFREFHTKFRRSWEKEGISYRAPLGELYPDYVNEIILAHNFLRSLSMDVRGMINVSLHRDRMVVKTSRRECSVWYEDIREDAMETMQAVERALVG
ncbi:hypothetical protein [Methanopyrus kandleri]|nr:hypothetical protein [Methanopyrus kandleri]HII70360.1 hypothetical protein [Methanopyrus kandleri]